MILNGYGDPSLMQLLLLSKLRGEGNKKPTQSKPKTKKEYVTLPSSAKTWRTYKLNVAPVAKNFDLTLTPAAFGGLTYEVLGRPQANVVTINTSKGKRKIFVGPDTDAKIFKK